MKKIEVVNLFVVVFFVLGFILLVSLDAQIVTGFVVRNVGDLDYLDDDEYEDFMVILKDKSTYSDNDNIKTQQDKFTKLNNLNVKSDYNNLNIVAITANKADIKRILKDSNVDKITLDGEFKILLDSSKSVINANLIWDKLVSGVNLTGVSSVCVLDTGVNYTHPNLQGRIILGPDYINSDNDPMDDNGHGTHVAGIITSNDSNYRGIGFSGKVVAVKVMNSAGGGSEFTITAGIDWCIDHKDDYNITVISMSIGDDGSIYSTYCDGLIYPSLEAAINTAVANNILVVSAAGNAGHTDKVIAPACYKNSTSIGGVNDNDVVFYNSASILDLLAPGVSIISTKLNGGFVSMGGTSMATPHVAAAILLIKHYSDLENLDLSVFDIKNVLVNNADDVLDSRNSLTFPRINLFKALVSLDSFSPSVSFEIIGEKYDDKDITLSGSAVDTFLDTIWVDVDGNQTNNYVLSDLSIGENVSFIFYANDSAGNVGSNSSSFVVLDGTPSLEDINKLVASVNRELNYQVVASDPTDDVLSYSDDSALFDVSSSGLISFTPSEVGNYTVNVSVNDSKHVVSDLFDLEVILNNTAPVIDSYLPNDLNPSLNENESLDFSVVASDANGGSLNYYWYLDSELVSEVDSYSFITDYSSSGNNNISIIVSDGIETDSLEWNVAVDNVDLTPNYLGGIENISFDENTNYSLNVSDYFVDLDGDSLSYDTTVVENITAISGNVVTLIPDLDFVGSKEIKFVASDPGLNSVESNFVNLIVNNVVVCGDGLIEGDEECDLSELNGTTCLDFAYDGGSLSCNSECDFNYTSCTITPPSGGGSPSGGRGSPTGGDEEATEEASIEEQSEEVKVEVKAEEKSMPGTGEVTKEEIKPKSSRFSRIWELIKDFCRGIFRWIFDLF